MDRISSFDVNLLPEGWRGQKKDQKTPYIIKVRCITRKIINLARSKDILCLESVDISTAWSVFRELPPCRAFRPLNRDCPLNQDFLRDLRWEDNISGTKQSLWGLGFKGLGSQIPASIPGVLGAFIWVAKAKEPFQWTDEFLTVKSQSSHYNIEVHIQLRQVAPLESATTTQNESCDKRDKTQ